MLLPLEIDPYCDGLCGKPPTAVIVLDSGDFYSFITESMVKLHQWIVDRIDPMLIHLATGSEDLLDLLFSIPIVFGNDYRDAIIQHVKCWLMKDLLNNVILSMAWL